MNIRLLTENDPLNSKKWDEYVEKSKDATFFHQIAWKRLIEKVLKYEPLYLMAEDDEKVKGILPLFLTKSKFLGKALISTPFAVYGGICADDEEIAQYLFKEAKKLAKEKDVDYLELRNIYENNFALVENPIHYTFIIELPDKVETLWNGLKRKARGAVRKGIKSDLEVEIDAGKLDKLWNFYNIFAHSLRNLGSFILPFKYFKTLKELFDKQIVMLFVKYKGEIVASVLTFLFKDTIIPYYGGCLSKSLKYSPNNLMYWKLMEYGIEKGYKYFDFGKSKKGTGSFEFKENFGFEPKPLHYQYYLNKVTQIPDAVNLSWEYRLAKRLIKKIPLRITKFIGPGIVKHLP